MVLNIFLRSEALIFLALILGSVMFVHGLDLARRSVGMKVEPASEFKTAALLSILAGLATLVIGLPMVIPTFFVWLRWNRKK